MLQPAAVFEHDTVADQTPAMHQPTVQYMAVTIHDIVSPKTPHFITDSNFISATDFDVCIKIGDFYLLNFHIDILLLV